MRFVAHVGLSAACRRLAARFQRAWVSRSSRATATGTASRRRARTAAATHRRRCACATTRAAGHHGGCARTAAAACHGRRARTAAAAVATRIPELRSPTPGARPSPPGGQLHRSPMPGARPAYTALPRTGPANTALPGTGPARPATTRRRLVATCASGGPLGVVAAFAGTVSLAAITRAASRATRAGGGVISLTHVGGKRLDAEHATTADGHAEQRPQDQQAAHGTPRLRPRPAALSGRVASRIHESSARILVLHQVPQSDVLHIACDGLLAFRCGKLNHSCSALG